MTGKPETPRPGGEELLKFPCNFGFADNTGTRLITVIPGSPSEPNGEP